MRYVFGNSSTYGNIFYKNVEVLSSINIDNDK
jgi:hypothetical protein